MKSTIFISLIILICISNVSGQDRTTKKNPVGKWLFEAPYAPQGYTNGVIELKKTDSLYSATMAFGGSENKYPGEKVKFVNDTISFNVYIEGQDVSVKLVFAEESKMTGKAIYTEGIVPLSLTREIKKD